MAPAAPYAELHCHSAYSFLDGVSLPEELVQRAGELGYGALALTDHNSLSGSMELAQAAGACGVRAIHGAEIDVSTEAVVGGGGVVGGGAAVGGGGVGDPRHITLLVRDERGWSNLCRIITLAHRAAGERSAAASVRPAVPSVELQTVLDHAEGLVCLTGCAHRSVILGGARDEPAARRLLDAFGPEDLYVELQRPYMRHDRARNNAMAALGRRLGVRCVATGDVHAHARARAELQDAFVALRNHATLDASEPLRRGNNSHVMSAPQAMASRFVEHPEAVRETLRVAERLTFSLDRDLGYRYPGAEDRGAERRLVELCGARLADRYTAGAARAEAQARLEGELRVIADLGLAGFFLLHHDMLELAAEVALEVRGPDSVRALLAPGRGRGSSVSSLVCYLIGLSHIDPIANGLALGRFLNEDLHGLPDIDLDFPRDIREVLIRRVHERYGRERTALVAAFPSFRARGAIRELGKVLGLPAGELDRLARGAEPYGPHGEDRLAGGPGDERPLAVALREPHTPPAGARGHASERWQWLWRLVEQAQGLPRHFSQHPGGMIVSTRPLIDCCPVMPAAMEGRQIVQWDKDSCADAGFLKIDLLGLGMLSAVERCVGEIARMRGERIDLSRIPFDDEPTFRAIRAADTVGVFQIESRAQMQSIRRTRPENLEDLTIQVAIVRPGPIQGGAINPYIERRRKLREDPAYVVPYDHPALEPILRETLGTIIFQDQVMQVAEAFAGFSPGEADGLRRAISRKRSHEMLQRHREDFIAGAVRHAGASLSTAERIWEMVEGFAGFGFPKAHGAAFGLLAYQSTWLRVHYGPEFLCALLNEQPMGFYAPDSLVHEAENRGIPVLGLDVNASHVHCTVEACSAREGSGSGVRLGLGYIKGVAAEELEELVAERGRNGPFRTLGDLAARAGAGRRTLEQLAWSGACDVLLAGSDRRSALWTLGMAAAARPAGPGTQLALAMEPPEAPRLRSLGRWQRLIADYATSGVTVGDHPMAVLRGRLALSPDRRLAGAKEAVLASSAELEHLPAGREVAVAGLVIARQRPGTAKGTMFLLFEDEWGTVNLIVPKAIYERHRALARTEPLLLATGRLERAEGVLNVVVAQLAPLERFLSAHPGAGEGAGAARVHRLRSRDRRDAGWEDGAAPEREADELKVGSSMRAVAPPVESFAMGRRR